MVDQTVKGNFRILNILNNADKGPRVSGTSILAAFALLTFIFSSTGAFPATAVERYYARELFTGISYLMGRFADAIPVAWLDVFFVAALALLIHSIRRRRYRILVNAAAIVYLMFFWSWGLNYHRPALTSKLPFNPAGATPEAIDKFAERAAREINRLYVENREAGTGQTPEVRVARVVEVMDGMRWKAATRAKTSLLMNPWFKMAGVDGLFNPLVHEPIVNAALLDIELPFVTAHEMAHVRGYPDEGEANLVAVLATVTADDPALQYSGWLHLWLYLRDPERDQLLDPGPKADLQRIFERARSQRVRWIGNFQTIVLDWFLKANNVDEGVRSYSQVVVLAAGTQPYWDRFK